MPPRGEFDRIELLRAALASPGARGLLLGIGDDAALLEPGRHPLVWSIDVQVEHVHFERRWLGDADIGYRATMAAASDLAAMGAEPRGVLASLVVPPTLDDAGLEEIATGQAQACTELGTALAGGNLASGAELSIATTVLGETPRPLRRDGAEVGHAVLLSGPVGMAAAGLRWLQQDQDRAADAAMRAAVDAFRRPRARIAQGRQAGRWASAAIDVSDGLASDLAHLVRAARQQGRPLQMVLEPSELCPDALVEAARAVGVEALELALHGGEDFALATTADVDPAPPDFRRIGTCRSAEHDAPELVLRGPDGSLAPILPRGFDHFRSQGKP
jgi:thiamine-monophosphate kinase